MRHCADIPNREGYTFIGVFHDDTKHKCVVAKDTMGCHTVRTVENITCFCNLKGWYRNNDKRIL